MSILADFIAVASVDLLNTMKGFKVLVEFTALRFIVYYSFAQKFPELIYNASLAKK